MNHSPTKDLVERLDLVTKRTRGAFGFMTADQLNWQAQDKSWSIGQILDHLMLFNTRFFPMIMQIADGQKPSRKREMLPILPSFWATYYRQVLSGSSVRKRKSPEIFRPSNKPFGVELIDEFVAHQAAFGHLLQRLEGKPINQITVTLPSKSIATMKLDDCCRMLIHHEEHHLQQAISVKGFRSFPNTKTTSIAKPVRGPKVAHSRTA